MASLLQKVREIFNCAQDGDVVVSRLCERMAVIQAESTANEFWDAFIHHVQKAIIYYKPEPAVERVMDFIANFSTYSTRLQNKQTSNDTQRNLLLTLSDESFNESEIIEPFLLACFTLFINLHNAREKGVRLRCCQLVNKMLNLLGDEDSIDEGLCDAIYECMMIRMKDIYPPIRVQAVLALYRLQDPSDEGCPIIDAYLTSLSRDINQKVRKTILKKLAISRKTLPYLIGRARDINDQNRKTTYMLLADKVSIRALSIAQRITLLTDGLKNDHSVNVKKACNHMLKAWFRSCDYNFIKLLGALDVESATECSELAMENLLKDSTLEKLQEYIKQIDEFATSADGKLQLIDHNSLTPEKVFCWYSISKHLKSCTDGELLLQEIRPELTSFCECIRLYAEKNFIDSAIITAFEGAERSEFILEYLLNIAEYLDYSDEIGRKNLCTLLHDLLVLESIPISLVSVLVKRYKDAETDEASYVQSVVETISDIKQPLVQVTSTAMKEKSRMVQLQLARVTVDMHECNDDLECAIKQQDYQQAALLKDHITELEKQKVDIQEILEECQEHITQRVVREVDPETTLKCLTIGTTLLSELTNRGMNSTLMALKDDLFCEGVKNEDPVIRNEAVKGLGLLSYMKKEFADQYLVLFLQVVQVDHEFVQLTAVKVIFDLFLLYGLTAFNQTTETEDTHKTRDTVLAENTLTEGDEAEMEDADEDGENIVAETDDEETEGVEETEKQLADNDDKETEGDESAAAAAESILGILLMLLHSESSDLRSVVAEGMAKVMITGRVLSANVLSRLILVWYNPITENDTRLRHCLATFIPAFAFQSRTNQELFMEAFIPTLQTITRAPITSPLTRVNSNNVINLFIQLTDDRNLKKFHGNDFQVEYGSYVHDSIAMKISNEILTDPENPDIKLYCRALNQLTICPQNTVVISDLLELSMQMIDKLKNFRGAKNLIAKFYHSIQELQSIENNVENQTATCTDEMVTQDDTECSNNQVSKDIENDKIFAKDDNTVICTPPEVSNNQVTKDIENDEIFAKDDNTVTFTPCGVLKNPLTLSLKSSRSVRSTRNVSFASPPHKMQRLSISTSSIDFQVEN